MKWPAGVRSAGIACGIKTSGRLDLGAIVTDEPARWAGCFTKNAAAAAPVSWSKALLGRSVRAVVCNSGNANACTGAPGQRALEQTAEAAAAAVGCRPEEILVASTGPIGIQLPAEKISASLSRLLEGLKDEAEPFSLAILTSDTVPKTAAAAAGGCVLAGVAKGSAMLAPNMATMLAFLATDADLSSDELQGALTRAVGQSFDRISVDACESTNDSVFLLTTGNGLRPDLDSFSRALQEVCASLAEQMVRDAEGATRLMRINIEGAGDEDAAVALGRAVAASDLWRCAVHGGDPNWGRVASALGAADRSLQLSKLHISLGSEPVFTGGEPAGAPGAAAGAMTGEEVVVTCVVGAGSGKAQVLSCDLSPGYVDYNARGAT